MTVNGSLLHSTLVALFLENNERMDEVGVEFHTVDIVPEFATAGLFLSDEITNTKFANLRVVHVRRFTPRFDFQINYNRLTDGLFK